MADATMAGAAAASAVDGAIGCVRCRKATLESRREGWVCASCGAGYPVLGEIPWLFRDPRDALSGWRTRFTLLAEQLTARAQQLGAELEPLDASSATHRRLAYAKQAYEDQVVRLGRVLAPLGTDATRARGESLEAFGTQLPLEQGLANYYVNVHRDWCWGDEENAASLDEIRAVAGAKSALGTTLVLGAGAGRLAYDLHQAGVCSSSVVSDFNPLLMFVAREMYAGRSLELYEFPIAPRRAEDAAVLRTLRAPGPVRGGVQLVLADALDAPFAAGAFDTVVTPWFIDIIGEPFAVLAARVNAWLKPGGRWINSGSLAFNLAAHAERLGVEEVLLQLAQAGFDDVQLRDATVPYMRSPASRHSRLETIVTWAALKRHDVAAPARRTQPEWLVDLNRPVPRSQAIEFAQVTSRVHAFLLALVNGERSVADMARMVVEQRLLPAADAQAAVVQFLRREFERAEHRTDF